MALASRSLSIGRPHQDLLSTFPRITITGLSPLVASTSTENGSTALFLWSENSNQKGVSKLTSEVLTESERRATMREKAGKAKTNNKKPSNKQEKKRCVRLSSSSEEIPLDTRGDSFDEDNNDNFCAVYKGYFYAKKGPKCDWIQLIECNK
ncbi:hypothetical protein TNIN_419391 [Trichonephila inaurata madagascariensis]|uniref:Uncharacterized protein n=1 Tax=Trichonephila inaurata madagascariensis TaxID=2747483 RepID=A0A8X7C8Y0_9ARAC|nr:hypothetical protein TNIN_419391 [Trichonephila inaurata madagascariensis]